ncbi:hypothetical protein T484DRAFT_1960505 [Baffinella frigidus]|nr:hypothetical protein T484DRAFT_1960505 [Cryptophyta sp. CCMP2293]
MGVLGGGAVSYERGTPIAFVSNWVKDCPDGYQPRILAINVSTVPDRPKPPQGTC